MYYSHKKVNETTLQILLSFSIFDLSYKYFFCEYKYYIYSSPYELLSRCVVQEIEVDFPILSNHLDIYLSINLLIILISWIDHALFIVVDYDKVSYSR